MGLSNLQDHVLRIFELMQRKDLILLQPPLMFLNTDLLRPPLIVPSMSAHFIFWLSSQQQQAAVVVASTGTRLARENWWVILRAREHARRPAPLQHHGSISLPLFLTGSHTKVGITRGNPFLGLMDLL